MTFRGKVRPANYLALEFLGAIRDLQALDAVTGALDRGVVKFKTAQISPASSALRHDNPPSPIAMAITSIGGQVA